RSKTHSARPVSSARGEGGSSRDHVARKQRASNPYAMHNELWYCSTRKARRAESGCSPGWCGRPGKLRCQREHVDNAQSPNVEPRLQESSWANGIARGERETCDSNENTRNARTFRIASESAGADHAWGGAKQNGDMCAIVRAITTLAYLRDRLAVRVA